MAALKLIGYHHPPLAALKLTLIGSAFVHANVQLPFSHAEMAAVKLTLLGSEVSRPSHCLAFVHAKVQLHAKLAPSRVLADMRTLNGT